MLAASLTLRHVFVKTISWMDYVLHPADSSPYNAGSQFESLTIERHYQSKKSLALAYLVTVGSKALTVADAVYAELNPIADVVRDSFDAESEIKRQIGKHTIIKYFLRYI